MSDLSGPTSKTDTPNANGVQPPGGCTSPNTNAHDPGGHGPHRVEPIAPNQLTSYGGNARTHSKRQIEQIAASIRKFGFNNPILINDNGQIVAGHGRVEAAKLLGLAAVPTSGCHTSPRPSSAHTSSQTTSSPRMPVGTANSSPSNCKG